MALSTATATLTAAGVAVPSVMAVWRNGAGAIIAQDLTNASGVASVQVADGTYAVWFGPVVGYDLANPYAQVVSGNTDSAFTCEVVSPVVGGLSFAEMRGGLDAICVRLWGGDSRFITSGFLEEWVNSGYQEVDRKLRWTRCQYIFPTVGEQAEYLIPVEVREVLGVHYTDADDDLKQLREISLDEYLQKMVASDDSGDPLYYIHHGDKFRLYPTPDTSAETVTLWIVTEPPNLSADADKPGFPAHLHQRVVDFGLCYAMRHMGQYRDAQALRMALVEELDDEARRPAVHRGGIDRITTAGP